MAENPILRKAINFLQSGNQGPLMPPVEDIGSFFTQYGRQGPLSNALSPAVDRFQSGQAPSPAEAPTPGATPTAIPRMDPFAFSMPVGMGSWQNIPADKLKAWYEAKIIPASVRTQSSKLEQQEIEQAREQKKVEVLIQQNPKYFVGRTPDTFLTLKAAEDHLKEEKKLELNRDKLKGQQARTDAAKAAKAAKDAASAVLFPTGKTGLEGAPVTGVKAKTAKDVLNKFGIGN